MNHMLKVAAQAFLIASLTCQALAQNVAVLPLIPEDGSDPRDGFGVSVKLAGQINRDYAVKVLSWAELDRAMRENGLDRKSLGDPNVLRRLGRALDVDGVVAGSFRGRGATNVARPRFVKVETGAVSDYPARAFDKDIVTAAPPLSVEPPIIDQEESLTMRDALADNGCEGAAERVDDLEKSILELKSRYWALQLQRGVAMQGLKFNPGSTISDPDLKRQFYGRMKQWMKQDVVPELTPIETKQFADADEKAIRLARRCGIL